MGSQHPSLCCILRPDIFWGLWMYLLHAHTVVFLVLLPEPAGGHWVNYAMSGAVGLWIPGPHILHCSWTSFVVCVLAIWMGMWGGRCWPSCYWIDQSIKSHNAPVPYPTMHHSEQKCAQFCSEWCIVGYGAGELWDVWTVKCELSWLILARHADIRCICGQFNPLRLSDTYMPKVN